MACFVSCWTLFEWVYDNDEREKTLIKIHDEKIHRCDISQYENCVSIFLSWLLFFFQNILCLFTWSTAKNDNYANQEVISYKLSDVEYANFFIIFRFFLVCFFSLAFGFFEFFIIFRIFLFFVFIFHFSYFLLLFDLFSAAWQFNRWAWPSNSCDPVWRTHPIKFIHLWNWIIHVKCFISLDECFFPVFSFVLILTERSALFVGIYV